MKEWIRRFNVENRNLGRLHFWEIKEFLSNLINRIDPVFNLRLRRRHRADFAKLDLPTVGSAVLRTKQEAEKASGTVEAAGLPHIPLKDWDTLIAFAQVTGSTGPSARVLDAGTERYSTILLWLYLRGYRSLVGCNLAFPGPLYRGSIRYEYGDIQKTAYDDAEFDAITCLSVIEHAVALEPFFREMARILKVGGVLVVSTDYWDPKISTSDVRESYYVATQREFSQSTWTIFNSREIDEMIDIAARNKLVLTSNFDKSCVETNADYLGKSYTFVCMTFRRT